MTDTPKRTPPHLPTYNVRFSKHRIRTIISLVFPDHELASYEQLESGKSYNNRIYFIAIRPKDSTSHPATSRQQTKLVLKISGHYFRENKIQNEVGSFLLLKKYCPTVPLPDLIAWSENGKVVQTIQGGVSNMKASEETDSSEEPTSASDRGWVLLAAVPGRTLTTTDLDGPSGDTLLKEIASHIANWRTSIPALPSIGNIRFVNSTELSSSQSIFELVDNDESLPNLTIDGLLLCSRPDPGLLETPLSYWIWLANDQLCELHRSIALKPLCEQIEDQVQTLIENMSRFTFFQAPIRQGAVAKFTHLDCAPRNILVTDTNPTDGTNTGHLRLTGILDVEFAACLPYEEEFLNMQIRQPDDWSPRQYQVLVTELAKLGCEVPHLPGQFDDPVCTRISRGSCTCDSRSFEGLSILVKVIANIAPWFIQGDSHQGGKLQKEIEIAAEAVKSGIEKLNAFLE